jgi:iron complex transport system permease protein
VHTLTASESLARLRRGDRRRRVAALTALGAALLVLAVLGVAVGSVPVAPDRIWAVLAAKAGLGSDATTLESTIVWTLRLPRVAMAVVVGATLSLAGAALQALVRNPLADPYVLGVSSGASLGAVAVMTLGAASLGGLSVPGAAFLAAAVVLAVVYAFAQRAGSFTDARLVLAGVALGYVAMAATSFLQLLAEPAELRGIMFWTMGSLAGARWEALPIPVVTLIAVGAWLLAQGHPLNALALGDDDAIAVGVDLKRMRLGLLAASAVLTAVAVSVAGGIGFIGLIVPHIMRLAVGADHRILLPASALGGAVMLVGVDLIARTVGSPNEYPVTIFTALIGGPFFLWLMRARDKEAM